MTDNRRGVDRLFAQWREDPAYAAEYEALAGEFLIAKALISARTQAHLSQAELARRIGTHQANVSRWEGGKAVPSTRTLQRIATATGLELVIAFKRRRSRRGRRGADAAWQADAAA